MVKRRTVLASGVAGMGLGGTDGIVRGDNGSTDELPPLSEREELTFDRETTTAWILERFIEMDSADHPLLGQEIEFEGIVIANLENEAENEHIDTDFQWQNFHFAGDELLSPLIGSLSWANPVAQLNEGDYNNGSVVSIAGIGSSGQQFYNRYEAVPIISGVALDIETLPEGTLARFTGTVRYADSEAARSESRDGPYIEIHSVEERESVTSLHPDDEPGDRITFVGRKRTDDPILDTFSSNVEFVQQDEDQMPSDGSLVYFEGEIEAHDFRVDSQVRDYQIKATTDYIDVLVGETGPSPTGFGIEKDPPDIVLVIDVSESMSDQDTRTGETRLAIARQSAKMFVNLFTEAATLIEGDVRLGIVSFSTTATQETPLRRLNDESSAEIERAIDRLRPQDDTSIGAGLQAANNLFDDNSRPKTVFLLSDGEENTIPSVADVLPTLQSRNVVVHTVGMGGNIDEAQLRHIAEETGGSSSISIDPSDIRDHYQEQAGEFLDRPSLTASGSGSSSTSPDTAQESNGGTESNSYLPASATKSWITNDQRAQTAESDTTTTELQEVNRVEGTTVVDSSCEDVQFSASGDQEDIQLDVRRPDGSMLSESNSVSHRSGTGFDIWTVADPSSGEWSYTIPQGGPQAQVEVTANTEIDTELFISTDVYDQTGLVKLEVKTIEGRERYEGADVEVQATPVEYNGPPETLQLTDDGTGPDRVANDGIYTAYFHPEYEGEWVFSGRTVGGGVSDLNREFEQRLQISNVIEDPVRPYEPQSVATLPDAAIAGVGFVLLGSLGVLLRWMEDGPSTENSGEPR